MKFSTLLLAIVGVIIGAWLLNLILTVATWLTGVFSYVIAGFIIFFLVSNYIKMRKHPAKKKVKGEIIDQ